MYYTKVRCWYATWQHFVFLGWTSYIKVQHKKKKKRERPSLLLPGRSLWHGSSGLWVCDLTSDIIITRRQASERTEGGGNGWALEWEEIPTSSSSSTASSNCCWCVSPIKNMEEKRNSLTTTGGRPCRSPSQAKPTGVESSQTRATALN